MFEYVIIGAGLAGSVMAERIACELNRKVLVVEERNHIAGNCYDEMDPTGILVHRYGPHIFHTDHEDVFRYLSGFTEWREYQHHVLGFIDGVKVPLPFNFNSMEKLFPEGLSRRIQDKLLERYKYGSRVPILELLNDEDPDVRFLADYVYRKVFLNYTVKQWGLRPEEIDPHVTARVPVVLSRDDRYFTDTYQGVPREGYTRMIQRMLNHENIKILLNTRHSEVLELRDDKFSFMGREFQGRVIFTGKIDELFNYSHGRLPYRSLDLHFERLDTEWFQEAATVNYPNDYDFTRITEFKHLHPADVGKTVTLREYPCNHDAKNDPYYPVFTEESQGMYREYRKLAEKIENLTLLGRLAEYRYYDMDDVVKRALEVFEEEVR